MTRSTTPIEQRLSRALRSALVAFAEGADFREAPEIGDVLGCLVYFLPEVLAEIHAYWEGESLDGFYLCEARKIGPDTAELRGACILISDQAIAPFHVQLRVSRFEQRIDWLRCRLGKQGNGRGGMERIPFSSGKGRGFKFLQEPMRSTNWAFKASFGEDESEF